MDKKGLVISFFNSTNLGDVVLADCLYHIITTKYPCKMIAFGDNPSVNDRSLAVRSQSPGIIKDMYNCLLTSLEKKGYGYSGLYTALEKVRTIKKRFSNQGKTIKQELLELQDALKDDFKGADFIVLGGGNMLFSLLDSGHPFIEYVQIYMELAQKYQKPIFIECIGIGPFKRVEHEEMALKLLRQAVAVTFRDIRSFKVYQSKCKGINNGFLSSDPALLLSCDQRKRTKDVIAVNFVNPKIMGLDEQQAKKVTKGYLKLLSELSNIKTVCLFSTDIADLSFLRYLKEKIHSPKVEFTEISSLEDLYRLYSKSGTIIASRMHSQIIAYTQFREFISILWQEKVQAFAEEIGNIDNSYYYDQIDKCCLDIVRKVQCDFSFSLDNRKILLERLNINTRIIGEYFNNIDKES